MTRDGEIKEMMEREMRDVTLDYDSRDESPAYVSFTVRAVDGYDTDWYTKQAVIVIRSTGRKLMDRNIILDRFHARLYRKYPNSRVTQSAIHRVPKVIERDELIVRRTTLRRNVTKHSNKLKRWEDYQRTLLINQLDSPEHLMVIKKIDQEKAELREVELKIKNRGNEEN